MHATAACHSSPGRLLQLLEAVPVPVVAPECLVAVNRQWTARGIDTHVASGIDRHLDTWALARGDEKHLELTFFPGKLHIIEAHALEYTLCRLDVSHRAAASAATTHNTPAQQRAHRQDTDSNPNPHVHSIQPLLKGMTCPTKSPACGNSSAYMYHHLLILSIFAWEFRYDTFRTTYHTARSPLILKTSLSVRQNRC